MNAPTAELPQFLAVTKVLLLAIAMMVGVIGPRTVRSKLGMVVMMMLLSPMIGVFLSNLPRWLPVILLLLMLALVSRWLLSFLLGEEAAGYVIGTFVLWLIKVSLALVILPFRIILATLRFFGRAIRYGV